MKKVLRQHGGDGSGNFGHAGRPGKVGGSQPKGEGTGLVEKRETLKLSLDEGKELKEKGYLLHGSNKEFSEFKRLNTDALYFSSPDGFRTTQAEAIADGPFGGYLYAVSVDKNKQKVFDPYADEKALKLYEDFYANREKFGPPKTLEYVDMQEFLPIAEKHGYNTFRVYEPAQRGFSVAISDPSIIKIEKVYSKQ